jgi:hypothetical protein
MPPVISAQPHRADDLQHGVEIEDGPEAVVESADRLEANAVRRRGSRPVSALLLQVCLNLLKRGGRAAVLVKPECATPRFKIAERICKGVLPDVRRAAALAPDQREALSGRYAPHAVFINI